MDMYPWQPRMVKRLLRAFAAIRREMDTMHLALRQARLSVLFLERELDRAETELASLVAENER